MKYNAPLEFYELLDDKTSESYHVYTLNEIGKKYDDLSPFIYVNSNDHGEWGNADSHTSALWRVQYLEEVRSYSPEEIYSSSVRCIAGRDFVDDLLNYLLVRVNKDLVRNQNRIVVKYHGKVDSCLTLCSLWLDNHPILIYIRAGENDNVEEEALITNLRKYKELGSYLGTSIEPEDKVIDPTSKSIKGLNDYFLEDIL